MPTHFWISDFVDANGLRLHYTRTGRPRAPKPALVLAHGFSDNGLCWLPVAEALASAYDVVMPDARGHGRSQAPAAGYRPVEMSDDLRGLIVALDLKRPILLGHSMGAITVLALAGRYPDLPAGIVLEDPPAWWLPGPKPWNDAWRAETRAWLEPLRRMSPEALIAHKRALEPGWLEAEFAPWADSKLQMSMNILDLSAPVELDWPSVLSRVVCPTLLLIGDTARGGLLDPAQAGSLCAYLPQTKIAQIRGAGHCIRRDKFQDFMDVVQSFLAGLG